MTSVQKQENGRHVTTLAGAQAEAILKMQREGSCWTIVNKSVAGLAVVEFWAD